MSEYTFKVKKGEKLSKFLVQNLPFCNFLTAKIIIKNRQIFINNKKISKDILLNEDDLVLVKNYENKNQSFKFFDIVYEDKNILCVFKYSGIEVVNTKHDSLFDLLINKYNELFVVHRIDRNTSGLVLFAKNNLSKNELLTAFKNHIIIKKYIAFVYGKMEKENAILKAYISKDADKALSKVTFIKNANFKEIITEYKLLEYKDGISKLEIILHTGRTHQIRAHMAALGHPVVGDGKYGKNNTKQKLMLYATEIEFKFPPNSALCYLNSKAINCEKITNNSVF